MESLSMRFSADFDTWLWDESEDRTVSWADNQNESASCQGDGGVERR
jgi:hypothetical protein